MKHRSKLQNAIESLRKQGFRVVAVEGDRYHLSKGADYCPSIYSNCRDSRVFDLYTARELIKRAAARHRSTSIRAAVRRDGRRERTFVRDTLRVHGEEADTNFPRRRYSDFWCYD
jgi:hypothetical protein